MSGNGGIFERALSLAAIRKLSLVSLLACLWTLNGSGSALSPPLDRRIEFGTLIVALPCKEGQSDWEEDNQQYGQYTAPDTPATGIPEDATVRVPRIPNSGNDDAQNPSALNAPSSQNLSNGTFGLDPDPVQPKKRNFLFAPDPIPWLDRGIDKVSDGIADGVRLPINAAKKTGQIMKENKEAIAKGLLVTGIAGGVATGGFFLLRNANKRQEPSPDVQYIPPHVDALGRYHQGYYRTVADGNPYNNFSTYGNFNPYTQQWGTVKPPGWP